MVAGAATVFVVALALDSGVGRRELVVPLLGAVVVAVWILPVLGVAVPDVVRVALVWGSLGIVNIGADQFGFGDDVQVSLLLGVVLVGDVVGTGHLATAMVATVAGFVVTLPPLLPYNGSEDFMWAIPVGLAVMTGVFIRAMLRALVQLSVAQDALAVQAASDERRRIAREIHDVVAHSLTVTMLHLTAARMAVARGDSGEATDALEEAERAGRQSLADVRRTVGLLRSGADGDAGGQTPMPVATDLAGLVDSYRDAGLVVDATMRGDLAAVAPGVGLAMYRIVQESLANVARHGRDATVTVVVEAADPVHVVVRSAGSRVAPAGRSGSGIAGMRERAEALGGRCTAGPDGDHAWVVDAVLPRSTGDAPVLDGATR